MIPSIGKIRPHRLSRSRFASQAHLAPADGFSAAPSLLLATMKNSLSALTFGLLCTCTVSLSAQPREHGNTAPPPVSANNPPPAMSAADQKWARVRALMAPPPYIAPSGQAQGLEAQALAKQQQAQQYLRTADAAKAFAAEHPDHSQAKEARRVAAKSLLQAGMIGELSREREAKQLVEEVRRDQAIPAKARLELVSLSEIVRLRPLMKDRVKFLAAQEKLSRELIVEFPQESDAYETLLRVAENQPKDADAIRLAREVVAMPASADIKAAAQTLLDRHALVGQSLAAIAESALGKDNPISKVKGRGIVVYTWATFSPSSMNVSKHLAKSVPPDTQLVGINFDSDVAVAQAKAASEGLPGELIYDARGFESPLAQALKFKRLGVVYVANRKGVVRSISAQRGDQNGKLRQAGQ